MMWVRTLVWEDGRGRPAATIATKAAAAMTRPTESTQRAHALNSDGSGRSR
jgi:hypothetical protein